MCRTARASCRGQRVLLYRIMFYDDILDIICEDIAAAAGAYASAAR